MTLDRVAACILAESYIFARFYSKKCPPKKCIWESEMVAANRVAAINPPIDDTDPIRKFSIDSRNHTDLQNPAECSPKGKPTRNFSIDPTSSIRTPIADAIFTGAISETPSVVENVPKMHVLFSLHLLLFPETGDNFFSIRKSRQQTGLKAYPSIASKTCCRNSSHDRVTGNLYIAVTLFPRISFGISFTLSLLQN